MQHERTEYIDADEKHRSPGWWFALYDDDGSKLWSDGPYETEALAKWMQRSDVDRRTGEHINLRKTVKKIDRTLDDIDNTLDVINAGIQQLGNNKEITLAIENATTKIEKTIIWSLFSLFWGIFALAMAIKAH
jgi:hypothetical protein